MLLDKYLRENFTGKALGKAMKEDETLFYQLFEEARDEIDVDKLIKYAINISAFNVLMNLLPLSKDVSIFLKSVCGGKEFNTVLERICERGINEIDSSCLYLLIVAGNIEGLKILMKHGGKINDLYQEDPLIFYVEDLDTFKFLLDFHVNIDCFNKKRIFVRMFN